MTDRAQVQRAIDLLAGRWTLPILAELAREGRTGPRLTAVEAFVLTQAFAGVLRAVVAGGDPSSRRQQVEDALIRLVKGFVRAG